MSLIPLSDFVKALLFQKNDVYEEIFELIRKSNPNDVAVLYSFKKNKESGDYSYGSWFEICLPSSIYKVRLGKVDGGWKLDFIFDNPDPLFDVNKLSTNGEYLSFSFGISNEQGLMLLDLVEHGEEHG